MALNYAKIGQGYLFRNGTGYTEIEKRQLFLRSYQFSRKQSLGERIKKSFFRVKKVIWFRLRSAKKLRKLLWFKFKNGLFFTSRRRRYFRPIHKYNTNYCFCGSSRGICRQLAGFW